jgi:Domain of unknown function (DUF1905)
MRPLDTTFRAVLHKSPSPGDWAYVVVPGSEAFSGRRGLVEVHGTIDGLPFTSAFVALGDSGHKLPVPPSVRESIGKQPGDTVAVRLAERHR